MNFENGTEKYSTKLKYNYSKSEVHDDEHFFSFS